MLVRQVGQWVGLMIGLVVATAAIADDRLLQWDQGLSLLDQGKNAAAAEHFSSLLPLEPDRLENLDGLLRAEERLVHADSVLPDVLARIGPAPGNLASRFLAAEATRSNCLFAVAADSFLSLGQACLDRGDILSAQITALKAARCRMDAGAAAGYVESRLQLSEGLDRLPDSPRLQRETQVMVANLYFKADELDRAEQIYRNIRKESDRYPTLSCDLALGLGGIMAKQRHLDESLEYYSRGVVVARALGDWRRLGMLLANLGYQETHMRDFVKAEEHLTEAELVANTWGLHSVLGSVKAGQGGMAAMSGERVEAVRLFTESVELSAAGGNLQTELGSRQRLGYNLALMGEYTEARRQFSICLEILERTGGRFVLNWVLGGLAVTNHKLGYLDQAAEYYRQALAVNLEMGDQMSAAWCLSSLGVIQAQEGNYRQALVANHQAMEQYQALDDTEGEGDVRAAMAAIYLRLGDYQQALQQARRAIAIAEEFGAQELLRGASHTMASAYSATGQEELAEQNYLRVIEIARQWSDRVVEIWALNDLASHYLDNGRKDEARPYLEKALEMLRDEDYYHVRSLTFLLLARASDSPAKAAAWAGRALELATAGGLPDREWNALSDLGWYQFQLGHREQAAELQLQSIELVESLRRRAGADELRRHMLRPALKPFERLIELNVEQDAGQAFTISERSRAQILAGRLQAAQGYAADGAVRATDSEERDLAATITYLQSRLQDTQLPVAERDSLRAQISLLENEFSLLKLRWSAEEEVEAQVLYPDPPRLEAMLDVLNGDEHLLSYFLGEKTATLFSVNRSGVKAYSLGDPDLIVEKVQLFLRLQRQGGQALPESVLLEARQELYGLLIEPAQQDIKPGATLVLVPDGVLHRVPFAYLHDGDGYLVESRALFTVPSLQVLGYLRQRGDGPTPATGVLAIGCAATDDRVHPFNDAAVTSLPHADEEAWRLAEIFDGAVILTGHAANEQKIRSGVLAAADIVHFAAHSYADELDFRHSYMVLNRAPGTEAVTSQNDGLLQWYEIVNLELNASLVTLASCRSAGGVLTSGEGITGLTQAFLYAGSRGVLATLTDVPDQDTGWVMDRFYRELNRGTSAAKALRTAQLAGLEQGGLYGAEFVLIGDGAVTHRGSHRRNWGTPVLAAVGLCLVLGVVTALYRQKKSE